MLPVCNEYGRMAERMDWYETPSKKSFDVVKTKGGYSMRPAARRFSGQGEDGMAEVEVDTQFQRLVVGSKDSKM